MHTRVLIIDTNRESGYLSGAMLRAHGIAAVSVPSASAAFHLLKRESFSLILTDIFEGIHESIKIFSRIQMSPVLLLTNVCEQHALAEGLRRGADGYIITSRVTADEFVRLIRSYAREIPGAVPSRAPQN